MEHRYKDVCVKVTRMGQCSIELAFSCWLCVTIPSILFVTEIMPISEKVILEGKNVQCPLMKQLLGLPRGAPYVCAQESLGWKTF